LLEGKLDVQQIAVPGALRQQADRLLEDWRATGKVRRLWARDASLWTGGGEARWLGWLGIVAKQKERAAELERFGAEIARQGFAHILLLGMGGSSLGPEVIAETFGRQPDHPELLVLDSTDPAQIRSFERRVDPARTLYIVSSKSGTTLEPNILLRHFFARAESALGKGKAGAHFIAITDPGSKLEADARERGFRGIFLGEPSIGGRYSVLSDFGLVPAAAMGLDVARLLAATEIMVRSCDASAPPADNPAVALGIVLGAGAKAGRDKLTILASPGLADFGAWLEQLVAESTGKRGLGIVPVDGEPLGPPEIYGEDRLFVDLRLAAEEDGAHRERLRALERAGHPVLRIEVADTYAIGQEFFRWEIATAVAGAVIGIDPFDQPDVEASKIKTRALTDAYENSGKLPPERPLLEEHGIALFADARNAAALKGAAREASLVAWLRAHFARIGAGDYCAFLAYAERNAQHIAALRALRVLVREKTRAATCVGFGPRFLHSTGQAYKGGPNSGVFLQITSEPAEDLPVPGQKFTFGVVEAAQARGDFEVLAERGRRALRVHLGADVERGLARLTEAIRQSLA
jgi:transaldolase / glucose-6-phosphate isomerase